MFYDSYFRENVTDDLPALVSERGAESRELYQRYRPGGIFPFLRCGTFQASFLAPVFLTV